MVRLTATALLFLTLFSLSTAPASEQPEKDYAFANFLLKEGKEAFALLELERFRFYHANHAKAPDATYRAARLYLWYVKDQDKARTLLGVIESKYPKSEARKQSLALVSLLDTYRGHEEEALMAYLQAHDLKKAERPAAAAAAYGTIINRFGHSSLAESALLERAKLYLNALSKPEPALTDLNRLLRNYPKSRYRAEALLLKATAYESSKGADPVTIAAYEDVLRQYPKSPQAAEAQTRIAAIRKKHNLLERKHNAKDVRNFRMVKKGYTSQRSTEYLVIIETGMDLSAAQVEATLEDALIKHYQSRHDPKDRVRVEAYYNYPVTKAGALTWRPGGTPEYATKQKRKPKDVAADVLLELLKGMNK